MCCSMSRTVRSSINVLHSLVGETREPAFDPTHSIVVQPTGAWLKQGECVVLDELDGVQERNEDSTIR